MPSKYGVSATDFKNWERKRTTPEYMRHLARCGKLVSPSNNQTLVVFEDLDNRKDWRHSYFPTQRKCEWTPDQNNRDNRDEEENEKEQQREATRAANLNDAGETKKHKCPKKSGSSQERLPNQTIYAPGVSSEKLRSELQHKAGYRFEIMKYEGLKKDEKEKRNNNISGNRIIVASAGNTEKKINPSQKVRKRRPASMKIAAAEKRIESVQSRRKLPVCEDASRTKISPGSSTFSVKANNPLEMLFAFCNGGELSIPLRPTFPKVFREDPPDYTALASEALNLDISFEKKAQFMDPGAFPFSIAIEERRLKNGTCSMSNSTNTVIHSLTEDRLEIHGSMNPDILTSDPVAKYILIIKQERALDGSIVYKGVYRRYMITRPKYMTWAFKL